ncbi:hypothetical protein [Bradyrhizobium sp. 153]|uniref:hypothetical protein n=1 Tax=Bradyrhizobium sp. 153 TaxID=2782627 RepID=UPI001FFA48C2|nr:hypothetical protein [Bradyrhizobium sp. 153]MCK1669697.1 hypothetical protein [Bradyrhizobium sp. 153]
MIEVEVRWVTDEFEALARRPGYKRAARKVLAGWRFWSKAISGQMVRSQQQARSQKPRCWLGPIAKIKVPRMAAAAQSGVALEHAHGTARQCSVPLPAAAAMRIRNHANSDHSASPGVLVIHKG